MKWIALIFICFLLYVLAMSFYNDNKKACEDLGGEYIFTDTHYKCLKEVP